MRGARARRAVHRVAVQRDQNVHSSPPTLIEATTTTGPPLGRAVVFTASRDFGQPSGVLRRSVRQVSFVQRIIDAFGTPRLVNGFRVRLVG
jgi:hypothetical protein